MHFLYTSIKQIVNATQSAFCTHFSARLDFTPKASLISSLGRISVTLDGDGTSSFISSLHLRPMSSLFVFPGPPSSRPLLSFFGRASLSLSLSSKLPSDAFSVLLFSLLSPRATRVSCPSLSSVSVFTGDFFRPRYLARSSPPRQLVFLLSHSGFRSVGLWGRKNERTNERTNERANDRTDATGEAFLSLSHRSLALGRSPLVRSLAYSLAQSFGHPLSPSLFAGSVYLLIATSPRLPRADRGLRQFPHPSRVPRFPRPCLILQQQQHRARYEKPLSVSLSCSLFARYHALFASSPPPFFLALSFWLFLVRARRSTLRPVSFEASFAFSFTFYLYPRSLCPSLSFSLHNPVVLLPPTLDTNSLDAAEFSFEATISGAYDIYPSHIHTTIAAAAAASLVLTSTSTSRHR